MKRPRSDFALTLLIVFGILIATIGILLHYAQPDRYAKIDMLPIVVGGAMAYFGALWKDPNRAERAGRAVTSRGREIVQSVRVLRTGGPDDPVVEIEKSTPANDPAAAPTTRVTVETPGAPSPAPADQAPADPATEPRRDGE